jgi:hypothetical protein
MVITKGQRPPRVVSSILTEGNFFMWFLFLVLVNTVYGNCEGSKTVTDGNHEGSKTVDGVKF